MNLAENHPTSRRNALLCLALISAFVVALALHGYLSRPTLDRYGDMYENYAWGTLWQWGYFKHPPFFAWETAAWFLIFPRTDFSYFMLAGMNSGVALVALWRIATRFGGTGFQVLVLALAMVMPPISFIGLNFNANSAMTPVWAGLFLFYLRGLETGRLVDAVVIGLLAGIAMLVKYHSAVMLATLFIHAVADSEARKVLWSRFGLVAFLVFVATITPHLIWLLGNDFLPVSYAAHQDDGEGPNLLDSLRFLITPLGYCALSMLVARSMRSFGDGYPFIPVAAVKNLANSVSGRALLSFAVLPLLLTIVMGVVVGAELSAVWGIPFYPAYAVILALMVPSAYYEARIGRAVAAIGLFLAILIGVAPFWYRFEINIVSSYYTAPLARIAEEVDRRWQQDVQVKSDVRPVIYGNWVLVNAISFYSKLDPITVEGSSFAYSKDYLTPKQALERGMVGLCETSDQQCVDMVKAIVPANTPSQIFTLEGLAPNGRWSFEMWLVPPGLK